MTDYLVHWTELESLWAIIRSGFFIATNAPRTPEGEFRSWPTIRGEAAVCFSETPIGNYLQSISADSRYTCKQWGIAVPKKTIFEYGGRPVIYGDLSLYERLQKEDKFLFCHFNYPIPNWLHEREWRARPNIKINNRLGINGDVEFPHLIFKAEFPSRYRLRFRGREGSVRAANVIPFHLPSFNKKIRGEGDLEERAEFAILVKSEKDKAEVESFIEQVVFQKTAQEKLTHSVYDFYFGRYRSKYLKALASTKVISLDYVREKRVQEGTWRLEDLNL